jgi:hypothetical protein
MVVEYVNATDFASARPEFVDMPYQGFDFMIRVD